VDLYEKPNINLEEAKQMTEKQKKITIPWVSSYKRESWKSILESDVEKRRFRYELKYGPTWRKLKKDLKNYTNKVRKAVFHKD